MWSLRSHRPTVEDVDDLDSEDEAQKQWDEEEVAEEMDLRDEDGLAAYEKLGETFERELAEIGEHQVTSSRYCAHMLSEFALASLTTRSPPCPWRMTPFLMTLAIPSTHALHSCPHLIHAYTIAAQNLACAMLAHMLSCGNAYKIGRAHV